MDNKEERAWKAKNLRYRRAALAMIQRDYIENELYKIQDDCSNLEWAVGDDETLADVFDGDMDEISEFRFAFSDLSEKCERLCYNVRENCVTEHFDDFLVGCLGPAYSMVGYDSAEEDYYSLTRFEAELARGHSGKRLMGLTKEKLIAVAGQCIGIVICFLDVRHTYDCLKATFDLLRDERAELMKNVRTVEDAYNQWANDPEDRNKEKRLDDLLWRVPERAWVE
jgi:hypothetical protein